MKKIELEIENIVYKQILSEISFEIDKGCISSELLESIVASFDSRVAVRRRADKLSVKPIKLVRSY